MQDILPYCLVQVYGHLLLLLFTHPMGSRENEKVALTMFCSSRMFRQSAASEADGAELTSASVERDIFDFKRFR